MANELGVSKDRLVQMFLQGETPLTLLLGGSIAGAGLSAGSPGSEQAQI